MTQTTDTWDLGALFKSENELENFAENLGKNAKKFEANYSGKLASVADFAALLGEYEALCEGVARVMSYAFLCFAKDTQKGGFYAKYELICNEIQESLVFFELEFCDLEAGRIAQIRADSPRYDYFLEKLVERKIYQLSKMEEKLLLKLSPTGKEAFSRLFDEHLSALRFNLGGESLSEEEILSKLHTSDRQTRKAAAKSLTKKLKKSAHLLKYIINIVRKDSAITQGLRGFERPESARHIDNQISQKSVDAMVGIVEKNFSLPQRYYRLKSEILGIKKLKDYDRYAPLSFDGLKFGGLKFEGLKNAKKCAQKSPHAAAKKSEFSAESIPYESAKNIVIAAYADFSPKFGEIVKSAFESGWIDSHPTQNKRGGAFSHGATTNAHPFVLLNYTNNRRDIFTIAHELGHALHQKLSYRVGYLNADTPLTTAETASVFGEMLLFERLKKELCGAELLSLYAGKIEDIFSTLFRQVVLNNFERRIHAISGELDTKTLNKIWHDENAAMFGESLKLTKNYDLWWSYIPHFIHSPFYCYAYSYGQLLSLTLFGLYKKIGADFVPKYEEFLSLGGSKSPKDLVGIFGFDIENSGFWEHGMREVEKLLAEFEGLR